MFGSYNNPYFNYGQPQMPRMDAQFVQPQPQPLQQYKATGLQGKSVDSLDVVKAIDIPLDRECKFLSISRSVLQL